MCLQVADNPARVWNKEWSELNSISEDQQLSFYRTLVQHLRRLVQERDEYAHVIPSSLSFSVFEWKVIVLIMERIAAFIVGRYRSIHLGFFGFFFSSFMKMDSLAIDWLHH